LGESDQRAVCAENPGLFAGDCGDGVAQIVLMVEGDIGQNRKDGVDDVGGIEAATETDFEDGDIDLLLGVIEEGEGGKDLEEAWRVGQCGRFDEAAGGLIDMEVEAGEVFVGNLGAVDADALVDADEVK
jgi:hypothetical protein